MLRVKDQIIVSLIVSCRNEGRGGREELITQVAEKSHLCDEHTRAHGNYVVSKPSTKPDGNPPFLPPRATTTTMTTMVQDGWRGGRGEGGGFWPRGFRGLYGPLSIHCTII